MVARSVTNRNLSTRLIKVQSRVREGMSLFLALEESRIMTPMTIRMVEVGEATGSLETMLDDISVFYEDEVNLKLQRLTTLVEPVIMLLMGIVVGTVVLVMYLPIFELAGTVK
jgi:type IV pilus assembly protein PilC